MSQACVFGEFENLVGIYQAASKSAVAPRLAVLILTPGMLHSAGPFRLHTAIADILSQAGIPSLRFDLSGIGESLAVGAVGSSLERAASEIQQAIDYLEKEHEITRVICFGLCSGADDAVFAALREPRIAGVYALDGCGFRTWKFHWHRLWVRYIPKLISLSKWWDKLTKTLGMNQQTPASLQLGTDLREFPDRETAEDQLAQLVERGVHLHFHYTGGVDDYYNYPDQFTDMFPRLNARQAKGVTWNYQPQSDHVGFLCEQRNGIVDEVKSRVIAMSQFLAEEMGPQVASASDAGEKSQPGSEPSEPSSAICPVDYPAGVTSGTYGIQSTPLT